MDSIASYTVESLERTPYPRIHGLLFFHFILITGVFRAKGLLNKRVVIACTGESQKEALFRNSILFLILLEVTNIIIPIRKIIIYLISECILL